MACRNDSEYYTRRADAERMLAEAAETPAAAAAHFELAFRYELLAAGPETRRAMLHVVTPSGELPDIFKPARPGRKPARSSAI